MVLLLGLEILWMVVFISLVCPFCWVIPGFYRIHDCRHCRRSRNGVVLLRPMPANISREFGVAAPVVDGYYVPASVFEECFPGVSAAPQHCNTDIGAEAASTATLGTTTQPAPTQSSTKPGTREI